MVSTFFRVFLMITMIVLSLLLSACMTAGAVTTGPNGQKHFRNPEDLSYLEQGKRYFETGHYKGAMRMLLPLACDDVTEAQYAVGYMYYYGYGVAQDTDVGYFWIKRAADKGFKPAIEALTLIHRKESPPLVPQRKLLP